MVNRYPFHIEWSEDDQEYVATCPAFPGLSAFGATEEEAVSEGKIALRGFIETCEAKGVALPEATSRGTYSGKLQLRLSKSQHRLAAEMAEAEGVSLNSYIADAVTVRNTAEQVAKPVVEEMRRQFSATQTQVAAVLKVQRPSRYTEKTTKEISIEQSVFTAGDAQRKRDH